MDRRGCPGGKIGVESTSRQHSQDDLEARRSERRASVVAGLAKPRLQRSMTASQSDHMEPVGSSTPCPPEDGEHDGCEDGRRNSSSSGGSNEFDTDLENEACDDVSPDRSGRRTYGLVCRKLRVNEISAIRRSLTEREIQVRSRCLSACDALALACALQGNSSVRTLDLEDNQLGPRGAEYLAWLLWENTYIQSLGLGYNYVGHDGAMALGDMLLENCSLTHINIAGNNIKDIDAILFAEDLQKNRTLQSMNLSHNHIGDEGARALGRALAVNDSLAALDLSWNKIRPPGGVAICSGIKNNQGIKIINLAYNGLSSRGTKAMAHALKFNRTLTDLDLTCNRIVDGDVLDLAKALSQSNTNLRCLRMANNPLTTASIRALLEVLLRNQLSPLQLIDVSTVHICTDALKIIQEVKTLRPTFHLVYAGVIRFDDQRHVGSDAAFSHVNPLTLMQHYIRNNNLRLVDLFKQLDKNGTGTVSREEFAGGLRAIDLPLTKQQLDTLLSLLDKDGDGEVDYGELVTADKENRRKLRHRRERNEKDRKERKQKRQENP